MNLYCVWYVHNLEDYQDILLKFVAYKAEVVSFIYSWDQLLSFAIVVSMSFAKTDWISFLQCIFSWDVVSCCIIFIIVLIINILFIYVTCCTAYLTCAYSFTGYFTNNEPTASYAQKNTTSSTCATASVSQSVCHYSIHVRVCALMRCDFNGLQSTTSHFPSFNTCLRVFTDMSHRTCNILHSILSRVSVSALHCLYLLSAERERRRETGGVRRVGREGGEGKHSVFSSVMFERWLSTDRSLFTAIQTSLRCSPCIYDDDICIWLEWVFNFNFGFNSNFNIEPAHRATLK